MFKGGDFGLEPTSIRSPYLLMSWPRQSDVLAAARQLRRAKLKFDLKGSKTPPTPVSGNNISIYIGARCGWCNIKDHQVLQDGPSGICARTITKQTITTHWIRGVVEPHTTQTLKLILAVSLREAELTSLGGKAELIVPSAGQDTVLLLLSSKNKNKPIRNYFYYSHNSMTSLKPQY